MHFDLVFKNVLVTPSYFSVSNFSYNKEENFFSYGDMKFISGHNYLHCSMVGEGSGKSAWINVILNDVKKLLYREHWTDKRKCFNRTRYVGSFYTRKKIKKSIPMCFYIVSRSSLTELSSSFLTIWLMEERIIL